MEGWQPIGTAPRDGRTILVYLPIGAGHPTRRQDDVIAVTWAGAFWARATGWQAGWETPYSGIKGDVPTHWRLLPDPPERPPFE
jgi:Protein of unknown function (DUF551)